MDLRSGRATAIRAELHDDARADVRTKSGAGVEAGSDLYSLLPAGTLEMLKGRCMSITHAELAAD
jgi:hypothetical protein